jgi:hypothetical protein
MAKKYGNRTEAELMRQWNRILDKGWLSFFEEAAIVNVPAPLLMGLASRESELNPVYLTKPGDNGNGFGLMQIDKRSYPQWVATGYWKDARNSVLKGALVLAEKRHWLLDHGGKPSIAADHAGQQYPYTVPVLTGDELQRCAIASYNSGQWAPYHVSKGRSPDYGTTGKDYSEDVLGRAVFFAAKYAEHKAATVEPSTPQPAPQAEPDKPQEAGMLDGLVHNDQVKQIASTGTSKILSRAATLSLPAAIGAWFQTHSTALIVTLIICGTLAIITYVVLRHIQKWKAAEINADPSVLDVEFLK